ncbi:MAG: S24/S26 family peptidase [Nitrospirales bacterium]
MIHLLPPLSLDGRFSTQDLPNELQLTLLNNMIIPRIVSSSMLPTIQEGDRLELSPPTSLAVGGIVIFRNDTLLICHRITAIDPHGTLSTRGDATQGACEIVQPGAVIGVVTGVLREGAHVFLGNSPHISSATAQPRRLESRVRAMVVRSITRSIGVLAKLPLFQPMLVLLLQYTATVDILTPAPLQSLPSHSKVASFTLRTFPHMAGLLTAATRQKPTYYVVRLGPWRLAQYDPSTESFLLRQSLRDTGLESFIRRIFDERPRT